MNLRLRQTCLIGAVGIACTVVAVLSVHHFAGTALREAKLVQLQGLAWNKREELRAAQRGWQRQATLIASRTQLRRLIAQGEFEQHPERAAQVVRILRDAINSAPEVENIRVLDRGGRELLALSYGVPADNRIPLRSADPDFVTLTEIHGKPREIPVVTIQVPLRLEGESIGALQVDLRAIEVQTLAANVFGLGESGEIIVAIRDQAGQALFLGNAQHQPNAAFAVQIPAERTDIPVTLAVRGESHAALTGFVDYRDVPVAFATAGLDRTGWGIVVKQDLQEALAPIRQLQWRAFWAMAVITVLALLLGAWLSGYDASRLRAVQGAVSAIRRGQRGVVLRGRGNDELSDLADAVQALATELDHAVGRLTASEARFRQAFDNAPIGMALVSTDGKWLQVNNALAKMLQMEPEDFVGHGFQEITHPEDLDVDQQLVSRLLAGRIQQYSMRKRYIRKDGSSLPIRLHVSLLRDAHNRPVHFIAQIENREDAAMREQERNKLLADLHRSNQDLEDFAYTASHDLKAPLRAITGFAQLLSRRQKEKLDADSLEMLQTIHQSAHSLAVLIDELLRYARLGQGEVQLEPVSMRTLTAEIVARLPSEDPNYHVDFRIAEDLPVWITDPVRMGQVLQNLISNAIKYNDKASRIVEISALGADGQAIAVDDNGIGISEKHREQIFKIFRRLHMNEEFGGGTGAGLTIVQKILQLLGGQIDVQDSPLGGARFVIRLTPAADQRSFEHRVRVRGAEAEALDLSEAEESGRKSATGH